MKITIISRYIPGALAHFEEHLNDQENDYKSSLSTIISQVGDYNLFLKQELEKRGHNVQFVIHRWHKGTELLRREQNASTETNDQEIIKKHIIDFNPSVVFLGSFFDLYDDFLKGIKESCKCQILSWISCPYPNDLSLKYIDKVFTAIPSHADFFKTLKCETETTVFGFPEDFKTSNNPKSIDVGFIGGVNGVLRKSNLHNYRTDLIKHVSEHVNLHKWGYGFTSNSKLKSAFKIMFRNKHILKNYHGEIWGYKMLDKLSEFKIGINCHGEVASHFAINHRLFETTGVGTLLLTDDKKYLNRYFEPGKEVVSYKNPEDCVKKIRNLINSPEKIEEISKAGQNRTHSEYKFSFFVDKFEKSL